MSQWVNLYRDGLKPREYSGALPRTLAIAGLLLIAQLGWGGVARWQAAKAEAEQARLETQQTALQERIARISEQLAKRQPDAALTAALQQAQWGVEGRLWLAGQLQQQREVAPLSPLLAALARQRSEPMWLTRIAVDGRSGALALAGRTTQADAVPAFVQRLSGEPSFAARSFSRFQLQQPAEPAPWMEFELAAGCMGSASECTTAIAERRP